MRLSRIDATSCRASRDPRPRTDCNKLHLLFYFYFISFIYLLNTFFYIIFMFYVFHFLSAFSCCPKFLLVKISEGDIFEGRRLNGSKFRPLDLESKTQMLLEYYPSHVENSTVPSFGHG